MRILQRKNSQQSGIVDFFCAVNFARRPSPTNSQKTVNVTALYNFNTKLSAHQICIRLVNHSQLIGVLSPLYCLFLFLFVSVLFLLCWESLLFYKMYLAPMHFLPPNPYLNLTMAKMASAINVPLGGRQPPCKATFLNPLVTPLQKRLAK